MHKYLTFYTDKSGRVETAIKNSFAEKGINCLELEIDSVKFRGSGFDDFELINTGSYTKEQLSRFTFNKLHADKSKEPVFQLCNCSFDVRIPVTLIDANTETEKKANLNIQVNLGKPKANGGISKLLALFELKIGNDQFISKYDDFETAMIQLQQEMIDKYHFKNCFSCHYSDYSPIGSGFFGSMMCFRDNKVPYLTATTKEEHFKVISQGFIAVQETYLCQHFSPREKDTGYRGWPFEQFSEED